MSPDRRVPTIDTSTVAAVLAPKVATASTTGQSRLDSLRAFVDSLPATAGLPMTTWVIEQSAADERRAIALTDAMGRAARMLAPRGSPPNDAFDRAAFHALLWILDRLHGCRVRGLGRLAVLDDALLQALVIEGQQMQPASAPGRRRATAQAGEILEGLAVRADLRACVADALGIEVVATGDAIYEYDGPGSFIGPHVDSHEYPLVLHILLEHASSAATGRSVLTTFSPDSELPLRTTLSAGESVLLSGRGTLHHWEPLAADERRTLVAIGFEATP
jgi:hypothetical protein